MKRPVFIVGCPRSGTTLLYSMLLAAGGFAVYRKETFFYNVVHHFPDLRGARSQQRFLTHYLQGYLGKVPGMDVEPFVRRALAECRNPSDFLPRLMDGITRTQGVDRWVEATPAHVCHMQQIKAAVPDAVFVHVIRDGRDCALSTDRQQWLATLPWDKRRSLGVAALFWEWMVRQGREWGRRHTRDYLEVRFEHLVADPHATLNRIGRFIDHDLDYDRILQNPVHSLEQPNTSFRDDRERAAFNPVGRWKSKCSADDIKLCERLVGPYLQELGYELAYPDEQLSSRVHAHLMRTLYLSDLTLKHWLKTHTPLARFLIRTSVWAEQPRADEGAHFPKPRHSVVTH
jgi:hypothetical protein